MGSAPEESVAVSVDVSVSVEESVSVDAPLASEDGDGGRPHAGMSVPAAPLPLAVTVRPPDMPREPVAVQKELSLPSPSKPEEPEPLSAPLPVPELLVSEGVLPPPRVSDGDSPVESVGLPAPSVGKAPPVGSVESVGEEPEASVAPLGNDESVGEPPGVSVDPSGFGAFVGEELSVSVGEEPEMSVKSVGDDESVGAAPAGDEPSGFSPVGDEPPEPDGKILVASAVFVG